MGGTVEAAAVAQDTATGTDEAIRIRGARVHNLQNLDLDIPRNRLVVVTGTQKRDRSNYRDEY
jgi:excinuclease ABC subunit A